MRLKKTFMILITLILFLISIYFSANDFTNLSLGFSILASITLIVAITNVLNNYINTTIFFIIFLFLYGLSGPINAQWGEGLHALFSKPYHVNEFLIAYSIANIALLLGFLIYHLTHDSRNYEKRINKLTITNPEKLFNMSLFIVILGVCFEFINIIRIGGISVLFKTKANYGEQISKLRFVLPSEIFIIIGFSVLSIYLGVMLSRKIKLFGRLKMKIIVFMLISSPYILANMILGKRGVFVSLFLSFIVGISQFKPLKKIKPKIIIIFLIFYISMSFLYSSRAYAPLITTNPTRYLELVLEKERIVKSLNPGGNEFGSAFSNYSEYYGKYGHDFKPKLGQTYIKGLVTPIPSFIYPGDKPKQITYEFRDEFFPSEGKRSSIAGTGFSSILEAYMNFKYMGVFCIYLVIGYVLQKIDNVYRYKNIFSMILYTSTFSLVQTFHRSAFGGIIGKIILYSIVILIIELYFRLTNTRVCKKRI